MKLRWYLSIVTMTMLHSIQCFSKPPPSAPHWPYCVRKVRVFAMPGLECSDLNQIASALTIWPSVSRKCFTVFYLLWNGAGSTETCGDTPIYWSPDFFFREEREVFIRDKYIHKKFVTSLSTGCVVGAALSEAVAKADMKLLLQMLAVATPSDVNSHSTRDHRSALHIAAFHGDVAMTQLLLWVSFSNKTWVTFSEFKAYARAYVEIWLPT